MKGGIVVALAALDALQKRSARQMTSPSCFIGDEEESGTPLEAARATSSRRQRPQTSRSVSRMPLTIQTAVTARRGSTGWQIDVKAKSAHSSQIFSEDVGAGAVYELARISRGSTGAARRISDVQSGPHRRQHAGRLRRRASRRTTLRQGQHHRSARGRSATCARSHPSNCERIKERMRKIVAAHLPHTSADDHVSPTAIRRWRRRKATANCWRCTTR